jgi:hypothetical protein
MFLPFAPGIAQTIPRARGGELHSAFAAGKQVSSPHRRSGRTGQRPPKLTEDDIEAAEALLANPDIGVTQIAHRLGISPATPLSYPPHAPRIPRRLKGARALYD